MFFMKKGNQKNTVYEVKTTICEKRELKRVFKTIKQVEFRFPFMKSNVQFIKLHHLIAR